MHVCIGQVNYPEVHWYEPWVGHEEPPDDAVEGASEMHHLLGCLVCGGLTQYNLDKIKNEARLTPHLWDNGHWGKRKFWQDADGGQVKNNGGIFLDLLGYLIVDEFHIFLRGGVRSILQCCTEFLL